MPPLIRAVHDLSLTARVLRPRPLLYADGANAAADRPAHVRAASGVSWAGGALAVIQDDAAFVALADPATGLARAVALPAAEGGVRQFDDARGNKALKLDLECCTALRDGDDELLLALGSGSSPMRERVVTLRWVAGDAAPRVEVVDASGWYALLRRETAFAGSELNVEGCAAAGGALRLFNRGNGAPRNHLSPVNATCDVDLAALLAWLRAPSASPPPAPSSVRQYDLGMMDGVPLTFTDAAAHGGRMLYTAAAEDSPDAVRDGPVAGAALGIIAPDGTARYAGIVDADGARFAGKVEGLLMRDARSGWIVIDRDEPATPSQLWDVELAGSW